MSTSKIFVTVDAVVSRPSAEGQELLFIKRKNEPFKGKWALPGGFVDEHEDLRDAAARELREETGLEVNALDQLGAFGKPHRDPRHHTVSVAYIAFAPAGAEATGADDAEEAKWFSVKALPEMAFDHANIVNLALQKIQL
ncbi:NUDIX hydrolase [Nostoc linckia z16]|nr:NUDIX hydrolase [Nostoc linckia z16]